MLKEVLNRARLVRVVDSDPFKYKRKQLDEIHSCTS
jgi:hypothetical protein